MVVRCLCLFVALAPAAFAQSPTSAAPVPAAPTSTAPATVAPASAASAVSVPVVPKQSVASVAVAAKPQWAADEVVALVHPDNPVTVIRRADLAAMFMGQRKAWANGDRATVLRRAPRTAVRQRVDETILKMAPRTYRRHWQRKELAGQGLAPKVVPSAGALLRAVSADRGAVGCISGAEAGQLPASARARAVAVQE